MTDHPDLLSDRDLEDRLRALLSERAAGVAGPAPGLPEPAATGSGAPDAPIAARPDRRWLQAAVAAAAVVILVAGAAVALRDPDRLDEQVHTTDPPAPTDGLPQGFDPETAGTVMRVEEAVDPEAAARSYLGWRLTTNDRSPTEVAGSVQVEAGTRTDAIVPVTWRHPDGTPGGTVIVRTGERGSDIVAATTPGVDLSGIAMDGERAVGRVRTSSRTLPGPALVDVLGAGAAFPVFGDEPDPPTTQGYGSATTGDRPFEVDTGGTDPIVSVRFAEDGAVRAIAELALDAPDRDVPVPDFEAMTDEERLAHLEDAPEDPRCTAAEEDLAPQLTHAFPGGDGSDPREPAPASIFTSAGAVTPTAAIGAAAAALGTSVEDVTITSPLSGGGVGGAWIDDAPVEFWVWQDGDRYRATEVTTATACWRSGRGNLTPPGASNPLTRLRLSTAPGIESGQLWYRTTDGAAWTVRLDPDDFARGNVAVEGEATEIDQMALVARDRDARVLLVQKTSY